MDAREARVHEQTFEIVVRGRLSPELAATLTGYDVFVDDDSFTHVTGLVIDQAALHGLISMFGSLNIDLVSVNPAPAG
ncbi:hypothetical protein [Herbiconiux ginsengi]|uniref:Uncharacterized protein n=1 Tax=Herbiconiux ginsengi TaxID=381665 RepID=A0A1H3PHA1_9MICO|nr:hypothetical protein [Herbiconiux ginsengi]SDZ00526.1 hypothetical protein SAMN05216554_1893 [Herbiconiux ginsengi]